MFNFFKSKPSEPTQREIDDRFDSMYEALKSIAKEDGFEREVASAVMNIFKALGTAHDADQVSEEARMDLARTIVVTQANIAWEKRQIPILVDLCITNPCEVTDNFLTIANSFE
jgi:hypothetical protein